MAFGIDDALTTAAAGISLTETIVETIKQFRKKDTNPDLELLLEQVRLTALERINEADLALHQFERMLRDREINLNYRLEDVVRKTPFWRPFEHHRLSQIQKRFSQFVDSVYSACDDVAALARCQHATEPMGIAVVESAEAKREFQLNLFHATSVGETITLLRQQLDRQKAMLTAGGDRPPVRV